MSKFKRGDLVRKVRGSSWRGTIVGEYSTELTPEGYAVESDTETGSVQIYPASALEPAAVLTPARMNGTALRKLDSLLDDGYRVNGVAIRREREGLIPQQGFVTDHGLVGWWPGSAAATERAADADINDAIEGAYWRFDARRKGNGVWKGAPMSERDAFKGELRVVLAALKDAA